MLILASNSPRRRQLLSLGGWPFHVIPADVDESYLSGETPRDYVVRLAIEKARAAAFLSPADSVIVAADTAVVDGRFILGKPTDAIEAANMLRQLRDRTHQVYTGLAVLRPSAETLLTDCCMTDVTMRDYSEAEIHTYVASGDPLDKAGAYAIQHNGFRPVERIEGCHANVVGLPLCHLSRLLLQLDMPPCADLTASCAQTLGVQCNILALKSDSTLLSPVEP